MLSLICKMETKTTSFKDLQCWQKARVLAALSYQITDLIKDYTLKDQFRRASVSIMNNIAEGYTRQSNKETNRFFDIAIASSTEVISMTYLFEDIKCFPEEIITDIRTKAEEIYKMTNSLARYFRNKQQ